MKDLNKKVTLRIFFFLWVNGKMNRITFHYAGTDLVHYLIIRNKVRIRIISGEGKFKFLKTYARNEWEKLFDYSIEEKELVVTYNANITGVEFSISKKDPEWMIKYDSIDFTGRIGSV